MLPGHSIDSNILNHTYELQLEKKLFCQKINCYRVFPDNFVFGLDMELQTDFEGKKLQ